MFYLLLFVIFSLIAFLENFVALSKQDKAYLSFFVFIVLWLVAGLRYETGVDWRSYTSYIKSAQTLSELFRNPNLFSFEPGFVLLCSFVKSIGGEAQVLFFIVASVNTVLLYKSIKFYTSKYAMPLFVYFCIQYFLLDMSGFRQSLAVNIFFFSIRYIINKEALKYFLVTLTACMFHSSAIFLFPLYFIINKRFSTTALTVFSIVGMIMFVCNIKWIGFILAILSQLGSGSIIAIKIAMYSADAWNMSRSLGLGFFMNVFMVFAVLNTRSKMEQFKYHNTIVNIFIINIAIYNYFYEISEVSIRFRAYFLIGNIIMFPYLFQIFKLLVNRIISFSILTLYCFYIGRIYFLQLPEAIAYNPYQNYLIYKLFDIKSTGNDRLNEHEKIYDQNNNK